VCLVTIPKKIYFSVFGSGLGHVTRIEAVAHALKEDGDEFLYSSFDEAYDYLRRHGENVVRCPSVDLSWSTSGGFSARDSFLRSPLLGLDFGKQVTFEFSKLSEFDPAVVVSDSRLSPVLASKVDSRPIVTILNQFKILFPPRFRIGRVSQFYERIEGDVLGLLWSFSNQVLMPDLPPPYTIGEANISGTDVSNRLKFVGFMTQKPSVTKERLEEVRRLLKLDERPFIFFQISGPNATKKHFVDVSIDAADDLSRKYNVAVSMGLPNGSSTPRKLSNDAWLYEWCPIKDELFILSDVLIGRSGHTTISQCIQLGKPAVLVPIYNHSEQIWNAEKFERLGLGVEIRGEDLSARRLIEAVEICLKDPKYKRNSQRLSEFSNKFDGIKATVDVINSYL
jgi:UDP-N-acetylglucosamine--N-acetylmuramyl-(pentapeptide) pyrophosphoryl-undecaprenol N-acetylglucosamine transferase